MSGEQDQDETSQPLSSGYPVYWRLYDSKDGIGVVCMQSFDEMDYDQSRFLSTERFDSEAEAKAALDRLIVAAVRLLTRTKL